MHSRVWLAAIMMCLALLVIPAPSWGQFLALNIDDASISLVPGPTDYQADYVEATGAAGIQVRVTTLNAAGLLLFVRCDDGTPEISLSDLLVKSTTAGTLMSSYTAITGSDQALWASSGPVWFQPVETDVRIPSLWNYPDAGGGGTTDYTNTLTYTVVDQ